MKVIRDNFTKRIDVPTVIILGSFDGIHVGHRALVENAKLLAEKIKKEKKLKDIEIMVCTFRNHPLSIIKSEICPKLIMSNEEKSIVFSKLGIDILNFMEFDRSFMEISPCDFVKNLKYYYNAYGIVVGFNYRFGYKNMGSIELLNEKSNELGYELKVVEPVIVDEEVASSSVIRHNLQEGYIDKANKLLKRPYMLEGIVVEGKQLGRTIDFPTANLDYNKRYIIPKRGVYGTIVEYKNNFYKGITNIGYNPTVNGKNLSIETHILNFDENIYQKDIKIYFMEKIRDEKKFSTIEDLKKQLIKDKKYVSENNYEIFGVKLY